MVDLPLWTPRFTVATTGAANEAARWAARAEATTAAPPGRLARTRRSGVVSGESSWRWGGDSGAEADLAGRAAR